MNPKKAFVFLSFLVLVTLVLTACQPQVVYVPSEPQVVYITQPAPPQTESQPQVVVVQAPPAQQQQQQQQSVVVEVAPNPIVVVEPTPEPRIIIAPDPWEACPGARLSRLYPGMTAYVAYDPPLDQRVRKGAGTKYEIVGMMDPGTQFSILDGPKCANGWVWWKIETTDWTLSGWTVEGDESDYWLVPIY